MTFSNYYINNSIIKNIITIETIYQNINIKKAIIVINNNIHYFIQLLKLLDHNVSTYNNLSDFNTNKKRLLVINNYNLQHSIKKLLEDKYIDTIFNINNNNLDLINKFKKNKIVIFNL